MAILRFVAYIKCIMIVRNVYNIIIHNSTLNRTNFGLSKNISNI